jgi:hypothetical protein
MSGYFSYFKGLSKPIRFSSYFYIGALIVYNVNGAYNDSVNKLYSFRNNKLTEREVKEIKDEWSAVKYGAEEFYVERFFNSLIWPVKICSNIVPSIVLALNKNPNLESNSKPTIDTNKTDIDETNTNKTDTGKK